MIRLSSTATLKMSPQWDPFSKTAPLWTHSFTTQVRLWARHGFFIPSQETGWLKELILVWFVAPYFSAQCLSFKKLRHWAKKLCVWPFMTLLCATKLQFDLSAPAQIAFPNSGAGWQQWNWARLLNVFKETQSHKHQFLHLKSLWDVSRLCFHTCFCERRPRRYICEC